MPLVEAEIDFHDNELKMSRYVTDRLAEIAQKMGPRQISAGEVEEGRQQWPRSVRSRRAPARLEEFQMIRGLKKSMFPSPNPCFAISAVKGRCGIDRRCPCASRLARTRCAARLVLSPKIPFRPLPFLQSQFLQRLHRQLPLAGV
jgi:hypothetical protein